VEEAVEEEAEEEEEEEEEEGETAGDSIVEIVSNWIEMRRQTRSESLTNMGKKDRGAMWLIDWGWRGGGGGRGG
jgi:hypothetical protein